jgi:hypothetical protein
MRTRSGDNPQVKMYRDLTVEVAVALRVAPEVDAARPRCRPGFLPHYSGSASDRPETPTLTERIARKLTLNGIGAAVRTAVAEEIPGQAAEPPRPR